MRGSPLNRLRRAIGQMIRQGILVLVMLVVTFYGFCTGCLLLYRVVDPPTTTVQLQRRIESFWDDGDYETSYEPVPLAAIDDDLEHAVVAAEDGRFFQHNGIDWEAVGEALEDRRNGRRRGGSTITQQLVKNLFLTTHSSYLRKGLELPLAYLADALLPKERILELYLNVIEWDPGIYGAEAAARHYFDRSAEQLTRYQAASLAAVIPNPRERTPGGMDWYTRIILRRMAQTGW